MEKHIEPEKGLSSVKCMLNLIFYILYIVAFEVKKCSKPQYLYILR